MNGGPPNNWLSRFGGSAWQWDETRQQYFYHAFLLEQPDLNWRNPEVRPAMADVLRCAKASMGSASTSSGTSSRMPNCATILLIPRTPQSLPLTLGADICGEIFAVGEGVDGFEVTDAVYGVTNPQLRRRICAIRPGQILDDRT